MSHSDSSFILNPCEKQSKHEGKNPGKHILSLSYFHLLLLPPCFTLYPIFCSVHVFLIWCIWWWNLESKYCVLCSVYSSVECSAFEQINWVLLVRILSHPDEKSKERSEMRWTANQLNKRGYIWGFSWFMDPFSHSSSKFFLLLALQNRIPCRHVIQLMYNMHETEQRSRREKSEFEAQFLPYISLGTASIGTHWWH